MGQGDEQETAAARASDDRAPLRANESKQSAVINPSDVEIDTQSQTETANLVVSTQQTVTQQAHLVVENDVSNFCLNH